MLQQICLLTLTFNTILMVINFKNNNQLNMQVNIVAIFICMLAMLLML